MSSGDNTGERNPFAPPPADAPDRPWQPRNPGPDPDSSDGAGNGTGGGTGDDDGERPQVPPPHPWSPGYQGGWSHRPAPQPPRLDPNDPVQKRARNAALAGIAALICAVAGLFYVALFVGALAVLWGVTALRSPRPGARQADGTPARPADAPNPLTTPALGGILAGVMTIVFTGSVIGLGLYYNDYHACVRDSLTTAGEASCSDLAPKWYTDLVDKAE
ncbi:hypothetical protein ACWGB8_14345 [Kitasatospora sp. NPDC054939]